MPAPQERLEEARRLIDLESKIDDLIAIELEVQRTLALDACDDGDLDRAVGHVDASSSRSAAARNSGA